MVRTKFIIPLRSVRPRHADKVGGKALGLARLRRIGLKVPPGFCITAAAFREHIDAAGTKNEIAQLENARPDQTRRILAHIREQICRIQLSPELPTELSRHYEQFQAEPVAVRSSATAEDMPGHSFAGQYETCLNVTSFEQCIEAMKKCWASLWTDRAYEYRRQNDIDHRSIEMAVIVQQQVNPDFAGVAFTVDPLTGSASRIVIEYCRGLGEALVSGKVQPDRIVLQKRNLVVLRHEGPAEDTSEPMLHPSIVRRLARSARKIERRLGRPQDIEWAIRDGRIWFLQTRPVTTTPPAKSWEDRQVWTNLNLGEVAPDVMTPITYSVIEPMFKPIFGSLCRLVGVPPDRVSVAGLVAGRIYFNINFGLAAARPFISKPSDAVRLNNFFGGEQERMHDLGELDILDEDLPDLGFSWPRYIFSWPLIGWDLYRHRPRRADHFLAKFKASGDELLSLDIEAMSIAQLAHKMATAPAQSWSDCNLLYLVTSGAVIPLFSKACRDWLGDDDLTLAARLFAALGGMADTQAGLDLWRLAELAHKDKETENTLLTEESWDSIRRKLDRTDRGRYFLAAWDAFMAEHGHHCRGELELYNARWSETPDYILGLVRGYLRSIDRTNPLDKQRRLVEQRRQLTDQCRRRLRNPFKRWLFGRWLRRCQKLAVNRENWKDQAVRHIAGLRRMLLALGGRLHQQGILADPDDVFFLGVSEIEPVAAGRADFDIAELIAARRDEYNRNCTVTPPPVVIGRFDPAKDIAPQVDTKAKVFKGIAVSPGVVTGSARVILRTDENRHVEAGEILVAPFTDPAWTPYFIPAVGVVMDLGGVLSHGAIIAREYGLPAVVNVGSATQIIRTGQTIRVDGDKGIVTILD